MAKNYFWLRNRGSKLCLEPKTQRPSLPKARKWPNEELPESTPRSCRASALLRDVSRCNCSGLTRPAELPELSGRIGIFSGTVWDITFNPPRCSTQPTARYKWRPPSPPPASSQECAQVAVSCRTWQSVQWTRWGSRAAAEALCTRAPGPQRPALNIATCSTAAPSFQLTGAELPVTGQSSGFLLPLVIPVECSQSCALSDRRAWETRVAFDEQTERGYLVHSARRAGEAHRKSNAGLSF